VSDIVVETIERPDGERRILIVRRADGRYSFCAQFPANDGRGGWGPPGPYLGIYNSAETAKWEALGKVAWLATTQPRN
jgi:hypothetical protein